MKKIFISIISMLMCCHAMDAQTTTTYQLTLESDDAWEKGDSDVRLNGGKLEMGKEGYIGLRYQNITIPPTATIISAYVEFAAESYDDNNPSSVNIYGELVPNALTFFPADSNISGRAPTNNSVSWQFATSWEEELVYASPDISAIIQEIINQGSWYYSNSLALVFEATSNEKRRGYSFNKDATKAPKLIVSYSGGFNISGINATDTTNWNEAYSWGDHSIAGYLISEVDPQVNSTAVNYVPKWDGFELVDGIMYDDGTNIGIGTSAPNAILDVSDDILVNSIAIGKGAGNVSTNTVVGNQSLSNNSISGLSNSAFGFRTLKENTTGKFNTAVGNVALTNNVGGNANTAVGNQAAFSNTSGQHNVAFGYQSLLNNITGNQNIGIGSFSLRVNSIGNNNTAIGYSALFNNTTGGNNTAIGYEAGKNSTGFFNTFVGYKAGINEAAGSYKLYIGNTLSSDPLIWGDGASNIVKVNGTLNINDAFSLPNSDGLSGQVLSTDGAGNVTWSTASGSGSEIDPVYTASAAAGISTGDISNWNTAYNWGDHGAAGYLSSYTESDPKVQTANDNYVPKWSATSGGLVDGTISMTQTSVSANWASAIGFNTNASGAAAVAMGSFTTASGLASVAMGAFSSATETGAIAMGNATTASGQSSIAMGENTLASGLYSTAMGTGTQAIGIASTAMGNLAIASNDYELHNGGDIRANGSILTSDRRYKKEISDLDNALDKVLHLQGVTFKYKDEEFKRFSAVTDQLQIGFIAQDVQEILPELVSSDGTEEAYLGIRYANLTAVLVEAIKEQQLQIETQNNEMKVRDKLIMQLKNNQDAMMIQMAQFDIDLQKCCLAHQNGVTGSTQNLDDQAHLAQNVPNPFNQQTIIKYYLPQDAAQAQIIISDMYGNLVRVVEIHEKGYGQVTIDANVLMPATYMYELIVGNERIETKRMIIQK